ncbi:MAG: hypothetical protein ACHWZW_21780 [Spirulina sp.]
MPELDHAGANSLRILGPMARPALISTLVEAPVTMNPPMPRSPQGHYHSAPISLTGV